MPSNNQDSRRVGGRRGKFITLEGVDGAGKSTHMEWIADLIRRSGVELVQTREPGGTELGEQLRALVLSEPMHIDTETLVMFAARREHMARLILPALDAGKWVLSDRFTDATFAYQGGGRQMPAERIAALEAWVQGDFQPDLTLVFDVPLEVAEKRRAGRSGDRFEAEDRLFFERVRESYLRRAREFPQRIKVIDSTLEIAEIRKRLEEVISTYCSK
ncbi:MAG TPA: dTMP kinase [Burkholderiales bacterium]|nr:dTMP kinase [Burkholderiales bacterium]